MVLGPKLYPLRLTQSDPRGNTTGSRMLQTEKGGHLCGAAVGVIRGNSHAFGPRCFGESVYLVIYDLYDL